MAKTRMLKPDLRTSEKVASWPVPMRYFWALLWGYVDDHGKGRDNPLLIKADTFPLDEDITGEVVDRWLWGLAEAGVVVRFTYDGTDYVQVTNWDEHQKPQHPTKDILPEWSAAGAVVRSLHASLMHDARKPLAPLTPELSRDELSGGDAHASEPPLFCSLHPFGSKDTCGPCADARRIHDRWERASKPAPKATVVGIYTEADCQTHPGRPARGCDRCAEDQAVAS